ncbi:DUF3108 domain-containing protein [Devosia sp. YIM 151766]|uniref:DUF3108 domain-containing protein n=1 Tax=Devosia sp. YIM 151766 TaxID=3017325 RepID=UPI00255D11C7|nr:DUF3108 domain-containing protein [Devosia sp. YIM 151766]WIY52515.1 DUF3108 domain-containing protein [Devosia sp. YIM 151766]
MIRSALALLTLLAPLAAQPVLAAPVDARVSYVVTVGGINVALVDIDFDDDGRRYGFELSARVTGLGNVVASGTAKANVDGSSSGSVLQSERFQLETRANGELFNVDVGFVGRNVGSFQVNPPVLDSYDRVPLERTHLTGVGDFLSSFMLKGRALDRSLCQQDFKIFTGVERFNIRMGFLDNDEATSPRTGYQGPLVACSVKYQPVSGHFDSSEMTQYLADTSRIILWYAPLGASGYFVPYRVIIGTSMGDLSMVLTSARAD